VNKTLRALWKHVARSIRDLAPIVLVITFFQYFILKAPLENAVDLISGAMLVLAGLTMFVYGLELALFPIGVGFGTTVAEPALTAVANEASRVAAAAGTIEDTAAARSDYVFGLRITVALSVGVALIIGVLRILFGWSLPLLIISGYVLVIAMTTVAPPEIVGIAYDSGGVTTSTVTVPLVAALGVGMASSLRDRNPMTDGFGLIAFASLTPMIFVMAYGSIIAWI
jgi:hypothetical protein